MATAGLTPPHALAERAPRRRRAVALAADVLNDRSQWTVTAGDTVIDVGSRAAAWSAATDAYRRGRPVMVRSTA